MTEDDFLDVLKQKDKLLFNFSNKMNKQHREIKELEKEIAEKTEELYKMEIKLRKLQKQIAKPLNL